MKLEDGHQKSNQLDSNKKMTRKPISRATVDLFCECPRCFYLQQKHGLKRPPGFPFTLNSAVDKLMKAEFDIHRSAKTMHPIITMKGLNLLPIQHQNINDWRNTRKGIRATYREQEFFGVIDDIWQNPSQGTWHVVDYKATAKKDAVIELDGSAEHHQTYKRQISFYTWLFQRAGFPASQAGYFVYTTGNNNLPTFEDKLTFRTHLIESICDTSWIEPTLDEIIQCLYSPSIPPPSEKCNFCNYVQQRNQIDTLK